MQKYQNNIVSSSGTPVISASISVTNYPSGTAATIYSDNGITLAANPLTSDSLGNFSFYAADGRYSLSISGVNVSATTLTDILLEDPSNPNPISATTISATGTATLAGVTATSLAVSGAATATALNVTGALSATGALTTNGLKEDSSGNFAVGTTSSSATLVVSKNITGAAFAAGTRVTSIVQPDVTSRADIFQAVATVAAGTYNTVVGYQAQQGTITGTVTNQIGFSADGSLTGATNNYGFYGNIPAGTNRYNFYANGTAPNRFVGETLVIGAAGLGYGTGAGGTVTQATSQTTAVTINTPTGQITMFSAAGTAAWQVFLLNNSLIGANDNVIANVKLGSSNVYNIFASRVTAGQCAIFFSSVVGTATEAPVLQYSIIKGATA